MDESREFLRRGGSDDASGFQQHDARSEEQSFADVVSDEHDGFAEAAGERAEFTLKFAARNGVERAEWLVHKKDGGIGGEGAGNADTLALTTRELARAARGKFIRIKANELQEFPDASGNSIGMPFFERGDQADVFRDGEVRKKAGFLNDVADVTAKTDGIPDGGGAAFHQNFSGGRHEHAIDEAEKSGLAAAAAAEKNESLTGKNGKRNIANEISKGRNLRLAGGTGYTVGDASNVNGRCRGRFRKGQRFRIHFD